MNKKNVLALTACTLVVATLVGCGGGGGGDASVPTTTTSTAEGLWGGTTSSNRYVEGIVLDNGTYWMLYTSPFNSSVIAGVVEGTSTATSGNFISTDAIDFNLEGLGILDATISGTYATKQSLNGIVNYPTLNQNSSFVTTYDSHYELTPSLTALAGSYTGSAAVVGGTESATLTISSTGAISGSGSSGCVFTGTAAPHARGNVYDVSVTFGGGVCSNGTSTVVGIGYYDAATKLLRAAALNSARTNGFIFVGTKP